MDSRGERIMDFSSSSNIGIRRGLCVCVCARQQRLLPRAGGGICKLTRVAVGGWAVVAHLKRGVGESAGFPSERRIFWKKTDAARFGRVYTLRCFVSYLVDRAVLCNKIGMFILIYFLFSSSSSRYLRMG